MMYIYIYVYIADIHRYPSNPRHASHRTTSLTACVPPWDRTTAPTTPGGLLWKRPTWAVFHPWATQWIIR